ncbi:MAG: FtsH protease activity modulator HflK [Candidatus Hydrogenedentes bacterium]|nr:FtsH protease activity modulator HflK [Candidatus Hydrogenedentota bacterium]
MSERKPFRPEIIRGPGSGGGGFDLSKFRPNLAKVLWPILIVLFLFWLLRGGPAYTVAPGEEGIVLTFGKYTRTTEPGFHFKLPWPIQTVEFADIGEVKRLEIGFRSNSSGGTTTYATFQNDPSLLNESQMLTGDENVVNCSMSVQFRVKNSREYLFNFDPGEVESMLRAVAEAALRQAVGDHPINDVLTTGKFEIMGEIKLKMQELADLTGAGVTIEDVFLQDVQPPHEVAEAFRDVASAREERERIINEAHAYQSGEIPKAEGEGERVKLAAEGYKEATIAEAQGAVARFNAIAEQYRQSPEITRSRLYLETMSRLLPNLRLTLVDESAGVLNLKNLDRQAIPVDPQQIQQQYQQQTYSGANTP